MTSRSRHPSRPSRAVGPIAALALSLATATPCARAAVDLSTWVTDGGVSVLIPDGGTLYVGGTFRRIGPLTGSGVPLSTSTLQPVAGYPRIVGTVSAVASDGAGGWYLGGKFSLVGGIARQNLAHITSALTVDAWNPSTDGEVLTLVVTPTDVVIGGVFATVNGLARPRLARISRSTGQPAAWTPSPNDRVTALASDGTTLYAAGWFGLVGATSRAGLAAFALATDALTTWDPAATSISPPVRMSGLALANGYVYVCGGFNHIGGQDWSGVAALRPENASATGWHIVGGAEVSRVLPIGDRVILGGSFLGALGRSGLAAVDTATGAVFPQWAPQPSGSDVEIQALEGLGARVAVGGSFQGISGTSQLDFAVIDTAAGAAASTTPAPTSQVRALARQGGALFVGGSFTSLGSIPRTNLAAFDVASGSPLPWAPYALEQESGQGSVSSLAVDSARVFAVITFNDIHLSTLRSQVFAFSRGPGGGPAWRVECDQVVNALAYRAGRVYVGGGFTFLGGARTNLGALDATSGSLLSWSPAPDNRVRALLALPDALVVGGDFANVGGQPRARLAQVDYVSGTPTGWNPGADGAVRALASAGNTLYAGGEFANAGGQPRARVAALDLGSNAASSWNPGADGTVLALLSDGINVYAGGFFLTFAGHPAARFAGVTAADGTPLGWGASANFGVGALAFANGRICLGGGFSTVDTEPASGLAAVFDPALLEAPPPSKPVLRLAVGPSPLHGGGQVSFTLERDATVWLRVLDVTGRVTRTLIAGERRAAGPQRVALDGAGLPPGVYHVQLDHDGVRTAARFVVLP